MKRLECAAQPQLIFHSTAVASKEGMAPSHHRSINKDGSKSLGIGLNMLHIPQVILHSTTVALTEGIAPGHHGSISEEVAKANEEA